MSLTEDVREACRSQLFEFSKRIDRGGDTSIGGLEIPDHLTSDDLSNRAEESLAGGDLFAAFLFTVASNHLYALEQPDEDEEDTH